MGSGKLFQADLLRREEAIEASCCCCHAPLQNAEVVREEVMGNRTTFIVRCGNCARYMTWYRRIAA